MQLEIGRVANGLYYFNTNSSCLSVPGFSFTSVVNLFLAICKVSSDINNTDLFWNQRLGHLPYSKMRSILSIFGLISSSQSFLCDVCPKARQH